MKRTDLPSIEPIKKPKASTDKRKYKKNRNVISPQIPTKITDNYQTESVFLRRMTREQKRGLSLLFQGCSYESMTLANNKTVQHPVDAIRWLLEQIDASVSNI